MQWMIHSCRSIAMTNQHMNITFANLMDVIYMLLPVTWLSREYILWTVSTTCSNIIYDQGRYIPALIRILYSGLLDTTMIYVLISVTWLSREYILWTLSTTCSNIFYDQGRYIPALIVILYSGQHSAKIYVTTNVLEYCKRDILSWF